MKITLVVDITELELRAIAGDQDDWKRKRYAPATREAATDWLDKGVRTLITGTLETHEQGGIK